jgi:hypothetical protein
MKKIKRRHTLGALGGLTIMASPLLYKEATNPFRFRSSIDWEPTTKQLADGQPSLSETGSLFAIVFDDIEEARGSLRVQAIPEQVRESLVSTSNVAFWVVIGGVFAAEDSFAIGQASFEGSTVTIPVSIAQDPDHGSTDRDERDEPQFHYRFVGYARTSSSIFAPKPDDVAVFWQSNRPNNLPSH